LVVYLFDRSNKFISGEKLVHYLGLTPGEQSSGCKQKAIVAVARKLMMKVHAVINKELDYEENLPVDRAA